MRIKSDRCNPNALEGKKQAIKVSRSKENSRNSNSRETEREWTTN